jgi:hypothetical protein
MKRVLLIINILLIGIILFQACQSTTGGTKDSRTSDTTRCKNICGDYSGSEWYGRITFDDANRIFRNYRQDDAKHNIWRNDKMSDEPDTKCVWFPLETIKRYIWTIENGSCSKNCPDSLGLRIYFAKYPSIKDPFWEKPDFSDNKIYADRHTLFIVPTFYDINKDAHTDFNPFREGCPPLGTKPIGVVPKPDGAILMAGDVQNHGSLIPPRPNTGTAFN